MRKVALVHILINKWNCIMKKIFFIFVYNILVLIILILLLEIFVRITIPGIKPQGTSKDIVASNIYYGSRGLRPNSMGFSNGARVIVDEFGFRKNSEIDLSKPSWLYLGDSVTMGLGIESDSTFAGIVQKNVTSKNILNPSVIGNDIQDYLRFVKYFIAERKEKFNIKELTIFWCLNDIYYNVADVQTPGGGIRHLFGNFLNFLRLHSRSYYLAKTIIFDRAKAYFLYDQQFYRANDPNFVKAYQIISQINEICKNNQILFNIYLIPYEFQMRNKTEPLREPQKLMLKTLESMCILAFDAMPYMLSKSDKSKDLFLIGDGIHLSNKGHHILADFILENTTRN